jgi:hypothetical protein
MRAALWAVLIAARRRVIVDGLRPSSALALR